MADVIGIVSGVVSIVQNARNVFNFIEAMKDAPKDIRFLKDELGYLINVLESLDAEKLTSTARELLASPLSRCGQDLDSFCETLRIRPGVKGAIDRFKWPLKEGETKKQIEKFERFKNLFTLVLMMENSGLTQGLQSQVSQILSALQAAGKHQEVREQDEDFVVQEKLHKVLEWLSPGRFDAKHKDTCSRRAENTGQWVVETPEFRKWISDQQGGRRGRLLWGKGHPGAGKTFLCSVIIDHLQSLQKGENRGMGVAYSYFTYDNQDAQRLEDILASLTIQLVTQINKLPGGLEKLYSELEPHRERPNVEQLEKELFSASKMFTQVFFVFDALDEYLEENRPKLLSSLQKMLGIGISIFVCSRPHLSVDADLECDGKLGIAAQRQDIEIYIERTLDTPSNSSYKAQHRVRPHIRRIVSVLTQYADGIFQLAVLLLDELRALVRVSVNEMLKELDKLENPTTNKSNNGMDITSKRKYDVLYGKTLQRLRGQHPTHQRLALVTLVWLAKAKRVLTIEELQEAVSVTPNKHTLTEDDLPEPDFLVDICVGLVTINQTDKTFRLVHETVQEYILSRQDLKDLLQRDLDYMILEACTTYLSFDIFREGPSHNFDAYKTRLKENPLLLYAAQQWKSLSASCDEVSTNLIIGFLRRPANLSAYLQLNKVGSPWSWNSWKIERYPKGMSPLHVACGTGNRDVVRQLLARDANFEARDQHGSTPLHIAASLGLDEDELRFAAGNQHITGSSGYADIIRLLLEKGADISTVDEHGRTPLHLAVYSEKRDIVELLLNMGADVSASSKYGTTPLHIALNGYYMHVGIAQLLLDKGADPSVYDQFGDTPLHLAVRSKNGHIVQSLLNKGANLSASDKHDNTPLHLATDLGCVDIVRLLLDKAANASTYDSYGRTPLHIAVSLRDTKIVRLLLDQPEGDNDPVSSKYGHTPLHLAVNLGHAEIVRLLLDKGVNASASDKFGNTPLHLATRSRSATMVQLLLDNGANTSVSDKYGNTPLHLAADSGRADIVKLLLGKDASVSACDNEGSTPLHDAVRSGNADVVRLLLDKHASVSACDNEGRTPLHIAVHQKRTAISTLLLKFMPVQNEAVVQLPD